MRVCVCEDSALLSIDVRLAASTSAYMPAKIVLTMHPKWYCEREGVCHNGSANHSGDVDQFGGNFNKDAMQVDQQAFNVNSGRPWSGSKDFVWKFTCRCTEQ